MNSEDFQKLTDICELVNVLKAKRQNLREVYSIISQILKLINEISDQTIQKKLKTKIVQLQNNITGDITSLLGEVIEYISAILINPITPKQKTYINPTGGINETVEYISKKKKYSAFKNNIAEVEIKITHWPEYARKLHEQIIRGKYKGHLHARITDNLRIIYLWNTKNKTLTYVDIITKNEFDQT